MFGWLGRVDHRALRKCRSPATSDMRSTFDGMNPPPGFRDASFEAEEPAAACRHD